MRERLCGVLQGLMGTWVQGFIQGPRYFESAVELFCRITMHARDSDPTQGSCIPCTSRASSTDESSTSTSRQ